ncbi:MAG: DUF1640 domain-containing protein [Chloroflexi bacterium]|nr:DUF1640 domain-containing protein [Chloroflexota bacterium]
MALFDTHKAVKTLTGAGFSENQAEALIDAVSEARGDAATNDDLQASEQALRADLQASEQALRADLQASEQALRADLQTLRADLQASDQAIRADMQVMEERLRKHIAEQLGKQTFQLLVAISALAGVVSGIVIAVLKLFP